MTRAQEDSAGFAELLTWIAQHAPGPRLAVSLEGPRSYGIGLARALTAAGLLVIECEQPHRKLRRGKGKSAPDGELHGFGVPHLLIEGRDADLNPTETSRQSSKQIR